MRLCNETITVFNARLDPKSGYDTYHVTVIRGVSWYCDIASNVDSSGLKAANKFTIRIPIDADFGDKTYLSPKEYAEAENPETVFTLSNGDIIIKGETPTEENLRPADLKKRFSEYVTILGVTDNRRAPRSKHWKVVGA
jgi:hypothetical protein